MSLNNNKGVHYIYDYKIKDYMDRSPKQYQELLETILDEIVQEANLNVIDKSSNFFSGKESPPGFAIVYVIDESHLSAHSYYDEKLLAIDIFSCGNLDNAHKAGKLLDLKIKSKLTVELSKLNVINRF